MHCQDRTNYYSVGESLKKNPCAGWHFASEMLKAFSPIYINHIKNCGQVHVNALLCPLCILPTRARKESDEQHKWTSLTARGHINSHFRRPLLQFSPESTQTIWLVSVRAWVTVEGSSGWVLLLLWICWVIIKTEPNGIAEREVNGLARRGWGQTDRHQMNKLWWAPFAVMRSNARLHWLTVQFPPNVSHFKMS